MSKGSERIAKRLSRAGLCSRREAERWIAAGRVAVNGETVTAPGTLVTEQSRVTVDGKPVRLPEPSCLWLYHKPAGVICTNSDRYGRPTVFDRLPEHLPRVMTVGRLDLPSEGLLLLTNDGELARTLELPATGWLRRYRVRLRGRPSDDELARLENGVSLANQNYGPIQSSVDRATGANSWLTVSLREGRNREIRQVFEHLGYPVNRLIRIAFGPFQLGNLPRDAVKAIPQRVLREQLGNRLGNEDHIRPT